MLEKLKEKLKEIIKIYRIKFYNGSFYYHIYYKHTKKHKADLEAIRQRVLAVRKREIGW